MLPRTVRNPFLRASWCLDDLKHKRGQVKQLLRRCHHLHPHQLQHAPLADAWVHDRGSMLARGRSNRRRSDALAWRVHFADTSRDGNPRSNFRWCVVATLVPKQPRLFSAVVRAHGIVLAASGAVASAPRAGSSSTTGWRWLLPATTANFEHAARARRNPTT